jgi:acyl carrier protein
MEASEPTVDQVKSLIGEILGIAARVRSMDASTELMGSLPELDSLAVAELLAAIEERFGFDVEYADITIDIFDTVGTLAAFVEENRALKGSRPERQHQLADAITRD